MPAPPTLSALRIAQRPATITSANGCDGLLNTNASSVRDVGTPSGQARRVNHHSVSASPGNQSPARLTGRSGAVADSAGKQTLRRRAVAAGRRRSNVACPLQALAIFEQAQLSRQSRVTWLSDPIASAVPASSQAATSVRPSPRLAPSSGRSRRRRRCWQHLRFPRGSHAWRYKLPARIEPAVLQQPLHGRTPVTRWHSTSAICSAT